MMTSARFTASSTLSTVSPSAFAFAADLDVACNPTTTETPLSRRFSACACPWLPYPMIATVRPLRRDMSASLSYQIVAIVLLLLSGTFFHEGKAGFGRLIAALLAKGEDVVYIHEPDQLLSKKIGALAACYGRDREIRRAAPLFPFQEKPANGRALPPDDRLHPRQNPRHVLNPNLEDLFHCRLPLFLSQLFFTYFGSSTTIVSIDWPAGHMGKQFSVGSVCTWTSAGRSVTASACR